jgi:hypothetical protein
MAISTPEPTQTGEDQEEQETQPIQATSDRRRPTKYLRRALIAMIALILGGGLVLAGVLPRLARQKKITAASQTVRESIPNVSVVEAQLASTSSTSNTGRC